MVKLSAPHRQQSVGPGSGFPDSWIEGVVDYAIFRLDPTGLITSWNRGAELIKGYREDEVLGRHYSLFYPAEAVERNQPQRQLELALVAGRVEDEGWRIRKDGTRFWANAIITPFYDADGAVLGFTKIVRDLTARRAHEVALLESEERFRLLVEGVKDYAIFMLDTTGRVESWNDGAEHIMGYTEAEILGRPFSVFYPPDTVSQQKPWRELELANERGSVEDEGWRIRKDGSRFWANTVITALRDDNGRLRGYAKVTRDLTERKRFEAKEEEGRQMTEFLAMLSHELRNPLAPIHSAISLLNHSQLSSEKAQWARDVIQRQAKHLTRLVDDLLDVSRITRGKISLHEETLDLGALVTSVVNATRQLLSDREHRVELTVPEEPLILSADATRISQIVLNLLNNAAKFTPNAGLIKITLRREADQAVLSVQDSGIGIAAEQLTKIFELFVQAHSSLARTEGGLGVGLSLARNMAELHGGSLVARSEGLGKGSEFVLQLPLFKPEKVATEAGVRKAQGSAQSRGGRVLIVDDNRDAAKVMSLALQMLGYHTEIAFDGSVALAMVSKLNPDIVLMDIGLPGLDGYTVAKQMKRIPGLEQLPIVAVTGYGQEDDRIKVREAGFSAHLTKPVDSQELGFLLDTLLGRES